MLGYALVLMAATGGSVDAVADAERLARAALAQPKAAASLAETRRALSLTEDFDPRRFVAIGRKGEVVEDTYREALSRYRTHRALLYEAEGECLAQQGQARAAVHRLRRALVLAPTSGRLAALARALQLEDRAPEALDFVVREALGTFEGSLLAAAQQAADAAAVPSLQAEIDRARLLKLAADVRPEPRDGPISFGDRLRLSTGGPLRLDEDVVSVIYVADRACRSCSSDIEALGKVVPEATRVLVAPMDSDDDYPLRQALTLYRRSWPVILGARTGAYGKDAPVAWVVGRRGWSGAVVRPPYGRTLAPVLDVFARHEVDEALPRAGWNRRPVVRRSLPAQPALLEDEVAPGEDDPAPPEFDQAVKALRAKQPQEALTLFEALARRGDGWLLSPEARLNRAVCYARAGNIERARTLLRSIGDSRFQEHVDAVLESLSPRRGR
jgi:tetratricopeptide (TPR) repeat protein